MLTPPQAAEIIISHRPDFGNTSLLLHEAVGKILAERLLADRDLPPCDTVRMDGIAIRYADIQSGITRFHASGIQRAGVAARSLDHQGLCIEVMTGAILPKGTDTVIPYEQAAVVRDGSLEFFEVNPEVVKSGQHIQRTGADHRKGDSLASPGSAVTPAVVGIAASVGKSTVRVNDLPRVAIVSTGDEIVDIDEEPEPYQLRRSNVYALDGYLQLCGLGTNLFHLKDDAEILKDRLSHILNDHSVVILSGGVSKGKYDLVPDVLAQLGITCHFHRVEQKPGKPMWFGSSAETVVFALPGNPVSALACAARYIGPFLRGNEFARKITLTGPVSSHEKLALLVPVALTSHYHAEVIAFNGSGDFASLSRADGFIEVPAGSVEEEFSYYPITGLH
ncbi:MAG: molybdopterin molybdotransferase MoeA [Flavobacteriales bacterium]